MGREVSCEIGKRFIESITVRDGRTVDVVVKKPDGTTVTVVVNRYSVFNPKGGA